MKPLNVAGTYLAGLGTALGIAPPATAQSPEVVAFQEMFQRPQRELSLGLNEMFGPPSLGQSYTDPLYGAHQRRAPAIVRPQSLYEVVHYTAGTDGDGLERGGSVRNRRMMRNLERQFADDVKGQVLDAPYWALAIANLLAAGFDVWTTREGFKTAEKYGLDITELNPMLAWAADDDAELIGSMLGFTALQSWLSYRTKRWEETRNAALSHEGREPRGKLYWMWTGLSAALHTGAGFNNLKVIEELERQGEAAQVDQP